MGNCVLCLEPGGRSLWRGEKCRLILAEGPDGEAFPGYLRVIWQDHVAEMSDLSTPDQQYLMGVVMAAERALRRCLAPDKINLAALGNRVPHLHWHLIPRWRDDSHFPDAIWAPALRPGAVRAAADVERLKAAFLLELEAK